MGLVGDLRRLAETSLSLTEVSQKEARTFPRTVGWINNIKHIDESLFSEKERDLITGYYRNKEFISSLRALTMKGKNVTQLILKELKG